MPQRMWNVMYNGVVVLPHQGEATIVGFAEYLDAVLTEERPEVVRAYVSETVRVVKD